MPMEFRVKHAGLLAALAAAYPCISHGAGAANVDFAVGDVKALAADGRSRPLAKGAEVNAGETIDTGSGRAQVRFSDGAQVSLQPQTQFRIDNYQFKGQADGSEKGFFSLLKGGMRTITGLIGRGNRQNYQVNTTVATIGIRGTEYSVAYGNSITVTTGEGSIEICNAAGCMILNSGESGYVASGNTAPVRTDGKTLLPPAQPTGTGVEFAATGETKTATGNPVFGTLPSGSGYAAAFAGYKSGNFIQGYATGTASFNSGVDLSGFLPASGQVLSGGVVAGALSDGILGWGRWATGTFDDTACCAGSSYVLKDVHYVVGQPTPPSDPVWGSGVTATYSLLGFTFPTSTSGAVGNQPVSASMSVNFATTTVGLSMSVPIGGSTFGFSGSTSVSAATATFNGSLVGGSGGSFNGFLAGANASRAGVVYQFDDGTGYTSGALAFKRQ